MSTPPDTIGSPFPLVEADAAEVLHGLGRRCTYAVNEPPWSSLADRLPPAARVVVARSMELAGLEEQAAEPDDGEVVVGIGGGTAIDTAKFLAWRTGRPLVQIPTITSVDAGFTDATGVRVDGRVRYLGPIVPELVVLDVPLVRSAPKRLNRAGIGDVLSCLTGLHDWRRAAEAGHGHPWREDLATLGRTLLAELVTAADDVGAVSEDGVRFLADAYRRIGAACAQAGHSRFEEGSEHFWAYCYEHRTGEHHVHGELIAFAVVALAHVQGEGGALAADVVTRARTTAHPYDLGITEAAFVDALVGLRSYARAEHLDWGVADATEIDAATARAAFASTLTLPRTG